MPIPSIPLDAAVDGRRAPALLFVPASDAPLPLVLFGHGAHLSKDDEVMQILARAFARGVPAGVALMDCPGHGERRPVGSSQQEFEHDVARRMSDPDGDAELVADWLAVEAAARHASPLLTGPLGYAGFSMGSLLGISIVADLPDVRAAVFALGGTWHDVSGNEARNARVREGAERLGEREVLMLNMTRDEHFPIDGAIDVLERIPGPKRMGVWAGTHAELPPESMQLITDFFGRVLG